MEIAQMHPLNSRNFGTNGMAVSYYNGTSVVTGYITKQVSLNKFNVTDGTNLKESLLLAPTTAIATAISSNHGYFAIPLHPFNSNATGATFTPNYAVDSATVVTQNGTHWNATDSVTLSGSGSGVLTVGSVSAGLIIGVTVGTPGSYTALLSDPVTGTRAAGTGATFTPHYEIDSVVVTAGGTGYTAGDTLTIASTGSATVTVTVSGGVVQPLPTITTRGDVATTTTFTANPLAVTGGSGTGATFTVKYRLLSTAPTAQIATAVSHAASTITVLTKGSGITVPAHGSPLITTSTTTATFHVKYNLLSVTSSGGTGYAVPNPLLFTGLVASVTPIANISTATSGAATAVTVSAAGSGITSAASAVSVSGPSEYVLKINEKKMLTTAGNSYPWTLGTPSLENSAYIPRYSDLV
jgi:hypothetical protein